MAKEWNLLWKEEKIHTWKKRMKFVSAKKFECLNLKEREKRIRKWDILLQMHWRAKDVNERKYNYRKEDGNSHQ